MELLVVGASGYIGNKLYLEALKRNIRVIGTKCRSSNNDLIEYDLGRDSIVPIAQQFKSNEKCAVICSAMASIDFCYKNKELTNHINVASTIKLINELDNLHYRIVFFSSDNVYDGVKGHYTEDDEQTPINVYGKMKTIVEKYILSNVRNGCVMRIGKTVGVLKNNKDMFNQLFNQAKNNEVIYCIENNIFSLTYIEDAVNCCFIIMENKMSGIYNIVGNEIYNRKELVEKFFSYLNIKPTIVEKSLDEFNFQDKRPLKFALSNNKFTTETGYTFHSIEVIFEKYRSEYTIDLYTTDLKNNYFG